jgi:hypothetical protein
MTNLDQQIREMLKLYPFTYGEKEQLIFDIVELIKSKETEVLDLIATNEGWEESRDYYAKKLDIERKYEK